MHPHLSCYCVANGRVVRGALRVSSYAAQGAGGVFAARRQPTPFANVKQRYRLRIVTLIPPHLFLAVVIDMGVVSKFLSEFILLSITLVSFL